MLNLVVSKKMFRVKNRVSLEIPRSKKFVAVSVGGSGKKKKKKKKKKRGR